MYRVRWCSGSNRSFKAYVFKRTSAPGPPYRGPADLLLDAQLHAPRLLQASLPRMLRSRRHLGKSDTAQAVASKTGKHAAGQHVRVTLQDNLEPSEPAAGGEVSNKRLNKHAQPQASAGGGTASKPKQKVQGKVPEKVKAAKRSAAVSAVEVADIGRTLKPADLNAAAVSTAPVDATLIAKDDGARGSRRHRRAAVQAGTKERPLQGDGGMLRGCANSAGVIVMICRLAAA